MVLFLLFYLRLMRALLFSINAVQLPLLLRLKTVTWQDPRRRLKALIVPKLGNGNFVSV